MNTLRVHLTVLLIRLSDFVKSNGLLTLVIIVALVRLAMLGTYPLMDTTEARYGDIGRVMAETGDWITPWFRPGVPFWAKPPLSFWCTALSFKFLGVNEFSARLPHWLLGVFGGFFVWDLGRRRSYREALIAVCLLAGCLIYYVSSGAVMTDMALSFGLTLSMWSFWLAVQPDQESTLRNSAAWIFFASLGWGLLAKGPLAIVLAGMSLFVWLIFERSYWPAVQRLPWIGGIFVTLLISGPWYWAAENKTPGFLNYFLIGEHIKRYLQPGWQGDRYGHAHMYPHGTIWLFLLLMLIPWTILIPCFFGFSKSRKINLHLPAFSDGYNRPSSWRNYLLSWGLVPAVFFTFAGNIIMPYVLPEIPALSLLGAFYLTRYDQRRVDSLLAAGLWIVIFVSILFVAVFPLTGYGDRKSERSLVKYFLSHKSSNAELVYVGQYPYSAAFYSDGKVSDLKVGDELQARLSRSGSLYVAIGNKEDDEVVHELISHRLKKLKAFRRYTLYQELPASSGG